MRTYRDIVQHYQRLILDGTLSPGDRLPTERQLALDLGVNRSTVTAAYDDLRASGMVTSKQGSGTRVSEDAWGADLRAPDWHAYAAQGVFHPTLPMVRQIWAAGRDAACINLARGDLAPDLWPRDGLQACLQQLPLTMPLGYTDPQGDLALRSAVSAHLARHRQMAPPPRQVMITSGSQQALHLLTQCLLRPGDAVALEKPSYAYSLPLFQSAGLRTFPLVMDEHGVVPEAVSESHRRHKIQLIFVSPTLQNPTGTTLTLARRQRLLDVCAGLRIPLVEDDAHADLTFTGALGPPPPLAAIAGWQQQVIYIGTLSKSLAPGLRVGWLVAPTAIIDRLAGAREQVDQSMSAISQQLALAVLTSGLWEENLVRILAALKRRQDAMVAAVRYHFGDSIRFAIPQGSYHLWAQLASSVDERKWLDAAIRRKVVMVPGRVYGADAGWVRLTYASSAEADIEPGIARCRAAFADVRDA